MATQEELDALTPERRQELWEQVEAALNDIGASLAHLSEEDIDFIAQAIASGATHLLTSDKDLLALREPGLPFAIVTPAELAALPGLGEG